MTRDQLGWTLIGLFLLAALGDTEAITITALVCWALVAVVALWKGTR